MRKYNAICLWAVIVLISVVSPVLAGSRYADGFRGIAWGTHKDQLPDLGLSQSALGRIYASGPSAVMFMAGKGNLSMHVDGIPLKSIFLRFQDQALCGADLIFSPAERQRIHAILVAEMGREGMSEDGANRWQDGALRIELTDRELLITHQEI